MVLSLLAWGQRRGRENREGVGGAEDGSNFVPGSLNLMLRDPGRARGAEWAAVSGRTLWKREMRAAGSHPRKTVTHVEGRHGRVKTPLPALK